MHALLVLVVLSAVTGCAGLTVKPVGTDDEKLRGFRYYEPSPYLLVYTDNQGGVTTQLILLPDQTQKRSARPFNYLAYSEVTLKFTNGMLTQAAATVDETAIPKAVVAALETAAAAAIKGAFRTTEAEQTNVVPPPYLFKIVTEPTPDKTGVVWTLRGGQGLGDRIKVTFTEQPTR